MYTVGESLIEEKALFEQWGGCVVEDAVKPADLQAIREMFRGVVRPPDVYGASVSIQELTEFKDGFLALPSIDAVAEAVDKLTSRVNGGLTWRGMMQHYIADPERRAERLHRDGSWSPGSVAATLAIIGGFDVTIVLGNSNQTNTLDDRKTFHANEGDAFVLNLERYLPHSIHKGAFYSESETHSFTIDRTATAFTTMVCSKIGEYTAAECTRLEVIEG